MTGLITDPVWWEGVKRRWLAMSLVTTGSPTDEFSRSGLIAHFDEWSVFAGETLPEGLTKTQAADELAELLTDPTRGGLTWNPHRQTFQGGQLI